MAKKQSKLPVALSPVAQAVAACRASVVDTLVALDSANTAHADANSSRSKQVVTAIATLWDALADKVAFAEAAANLFGNGERGKANVRGQIADDLAAKGIKSIAVRSMLSQARTVAANFSRADVRKAASESGVRAGYDVAKPKTETVTTPKALPEARPISFAEIMAAEVQRVGAVGVLAVLESCLVAGKDTIRAGVIHDARIKMA